jgi:CRP-like cAMP-binding protein
MLAEVPMFPDLPMAALKVLAYLCRCETIREGEYLFRRGEPDRQAYRIITGNALLLLDKNGCEQPLRQVGEGDFLGGVSLLANMDRLFSVKAESRLTCLVVSGDAIEKIVDQFPDAAMIMTRSIIEAVAGWERKFINDHLPHCVECRSLAGITLLVTVRAPGEALAVLDR